VIGGETSPDVWRNEIEPGLPADHVWRTHMGGQARRHSCISLPMLENMHSIAIYFHVRFKGVSEGSRKHQAATRDCSSSQECRP
jgi:hypothetical protein